MTVVHAVIELRGAFTPHGQPLPAGLGVMTFVLDKVEPGWQIIAFQNTSVAPSPSAAER